MENAHADSELQPWEVNPMEKEVYLFFFQGNIVGLSRQAWIFFSNFKNPPPNVAYSILFLTLGPRGVIGS